MIQTIDTFENDKYQTWEAESVDAAREKLKMRLLRRMDKTGLLRVNFDPLLTRLLREVRCAASRASATQASWTRLRAGDTVENLPRSLFQAVTTAKPVHPSRVRRPVGPAFREA